MTVELTFAKPPGVNKVRRYDWANHKTYKAWREEAGWQIKIQRPDHVPGPIKLDVAIEEGRGDLDGFLKQAIDLLVGYGVIEDDNPRIVRDIHLYFDASVTGCRVRVEQIA